MLTFRFHIGSLNKQCFLKNRWRRIRLPSCDGHPRHVDQVPQGAEGRRLEHGLPRPHADQPAMDGEVHLLRRIPRPGTSTEIVVMTKKVTVAYLINLKVIACKCKLNE
jgi:hypothetical protein